MKKFITTFATILFLAIGLPLFGQVEFKVELLPDNTTYRVSLRPTVTTILNPTSTAQVTILVPTGGFVPDLANINNLAGTWSGTQDAVAPIQNLPYDYYSFGLTSIPTTAITYTAGVEVPLFEFSNIGVCTGEVVLMESSDPDLIGINEGNQITVLGYGTDNAWSGNYDAGGADCREDTFIADLINPGEDVEICPDIDWALGLGVSVSLCDFGSLIGTTPGLGGDFSVDLTTGCLTYTANAGLMTAGVDTLCMIVCNVNGLCDSIDLVIPIAGIDTLYAPPLDPGETFELCADLGFLTGGVLSIDDCNGNTSGVTADLGGSFNLGLGCIEYTAAATSTVGIDTLCMAICDENNICDTITFIFPITEPDTLITDPVTAGELVEICLDLDWLSDDGTAFVSNLCDGSLLGLSLDLDGSYILNPLTGCLTYTASSSPPNSGIDTVCVVTCDLLLGCDTTIVLVPVINSDLIALGPIDPGEDISVCLDTDWIPGGLGSIIDADLGGLAGVSAGLGGNFTIDPVNACIDFTAPENLGVAGVDTIEIILCDPLNIICDTTTLLIGITAADTLSAPGLLPGEMTTLCIDDGFSISGIIGTTDCDGNLIGVGANIGGSYVVNSLTGCVTYTAPLNPTAVGADTLCIEICDPSSGCDITTLIFPLQGAGIAAKAFLQGPFVAGEGMMHDSLRAKGYIPLLEPYTLNPLFVHTTGGLELTSNPVLILEGQDAIVDWVFLELRDETNPAIVISTKSALIQRDGDIVDVDGISPVNFLVAPGDYYFSVRHRNHLGIMTPAPVSVGATLANIDFTQAATSTFGTFAQTTAPSGEYVMWGGNANSDGHVILQGSGLGLPDHNFIFTEVLLALDNLTAAPNYIFEDYTEADTNMDGEAIYQGVNNDIDLLIFFNVLLHPLNTGTLFNFTIDQQLP